MEQKKTHGKLSRWKKILTGAAVIAVILAGVYFGAAVYFYFHFMPGTRINGIDCSMKKPEEFQRELEKTVENYTLTIIGPSENSSVINGRDIDLKLVSDDQVQSAVRRQNVLIWPAFFLKETEMDVPFSVTYNETVLAEKIRGLDVMVSGSAGAESACPVFDGEGFVIKPEVYGVTFDAAEQKIRQCLRELKPELNLLEEDCLEAPDFLSDSPEVEKACQVMDQYCKARIIYTMDQEVTVDAKIISGWLACDEEMNVSLNEEAVREWVYSLAEKYDTAGRTRNITAPSGKTAEVSGGTYGWSINIEAETAALTENIRNADIVSREPVYSQRAAARSAQDWGGTYLEVDLTAQYMWYIKDGTIQLETDVVTGEPVSGMETPQGVYSILYTQRDAVLTGDIDPKTGAPLYRTGVRYWMPFTQQGHGFHDADWQSSFGGNVYTYSGSHGCVNMPVEKAGELFAMLEAGTPVVIHY